MPLDPAYPQDRLTFMMDDAQVALLLTQQHVVEALPAHEVRTICVDAEWDVIAQESASNPDFGVQADDLAYVIYTSGSTGRPKGVMITHRGLVNFSRGGQNRFLNIDENSRVLQLASINFDASISESFNALLAGAQLVLATAEAGMLGQPLLDLLREQQVTHMMVAPSTLATLSPDDLPDLQGISAGGEASSMELVSRWAPGRHYFNAYGPTEATVCVTMTELHADDEKVTIGRPLANVQIYLLDAHLQPVPIGVTGEIYIGSIGLARGYLNRPELTEQTFIPNPFGTQPGERLYKTGDLGRYLADGRIEYVGRIDHQVKIRGIRIELGEIETELLQHEAVREAVVLVREDHPGEKRLVAYLVADGEQHLTPADLKQHLQAKLPKYMVPASYVMLEALPLNPSGKLDRHALPVPDSSHLVANGEYVAPRNRAEERVAEIFTNTLHVESVSIHDNFFELGGHSLLATQVISRIIEEFGVQVTVRDLFAGPSGAELTERVQSQATAGASALLAPPIVPVSREGQLSASFAQQRLWFADQMEANSAMYNMREVVRLTGPLDQEALLRSLNEIVRRHESLRTTFAEVDGQPIQIIRPFTPLEMPMIDLQAFAETEREEVALRIAVSEAQQPFDLQNDLLIRARLLKLGTEQHMLLVITHHIANDGWSTGVFYSELKALYEACLAGAASPLPELPVQYADFAEWQRNWMQGDVLDAQLAYWKQQLSGDLPILKVQSDRPRPAKSVCQGATLAMEVPHSLAKQLHQLSQRMGTSLYMPMLAAYQTLMYRYSGQQDFLIGSPIANRNHREIEGLIGFFVNMLTLRADLSGNPTFEELIQRVQHVALDAFAHQDLP
ncbi:MAG: amino acid adenylation domain-containing protein, partial [Tumebacillaceae bacterium]